MGHYTSLEIYIQAKVGGGGETFSSGLFPFQAPVLSHAFESNPHETHWIWVSVCLCLSVYLSLSLSVSVSFSLSLSHTHTHTHTRKDTSGKKGISGGGSRRKQGENTIERHYGVHGHKMLNAQ